MNREELTKAVAEILSTASRKGGPSELEIQSTAQKVLVKSITGIFIDCEISISTAMDVLDQVKRTIAAETVINGEANEKEFFS